MESDQAIINKADLAQDHSYLLKALNERVAVLERKVAALSQPDPELDKIRMMNRCYGASA